MKRKSWLMGVFVVLTLIYTFCCITFDKTGFNTPSLLFGLPIWLVAGVVVGGMLVVGANWNPIKDPGAYGETPGWLFWLFGGLFFLALFLGTYFTEPVVCTGQDGDYCYESKTVYEIARNDGSTYRATYRGSWVWVPYHLVDDAVTTSTFQTTSAGSSGFLADLDLGDGEGVILIIVIVIIIIIVLSAAIVPNLWVVACGLCLTGFALGILRLHRQEVLYGGRKFEEEQEQLKQKPKYTEDPLGTGVDETYTA